MFLSLPVPSSSSPPPRWSTHQSVNTFANYFWLQFLTWGNPPTAKSQRRNISQPLKSCFKFLLSRSGHRRKLGNNQRASEEVFIALNMENFGLQFLGGWFNDPASNRSFAEIIIVILCQREHTNVFEIRPTTREHHSYSSLVQARSRVTRERDASPTWAGAGPSKDSVEDGEGRWHSIH